jgi:hypothetical protein
MMDRQQIQRFRLRAEEERQRARFFRVQEQAESCLTLATKYEAAADAYELLLKR